MLFRARFVKTLLRHFGHFPLRQRRQKIEAGKIKSKAASKFIKDHAKKDREENTHYFLLSLLCNGGLMKRLFPDVDLSRYTTLHDDDDQRAEEE